MKASFQQHGYAVARGLFSEAEVEEIKTNFDRIAENGPIPGYFEPLSKEESGGDPLKQFPRIIHPTDLTTSPAGIWSIPASSHACMN
jgi:hypothetical protein